MTGKIVLLTKQTPQEFIVSSVGKMNPVKHLNKEIEEIQHANVTNCLTTTTFTEGGLYLGEIGDSLKTRRAEAFTGPTVMFSRRTI